MIKMLKIWKIKLDMKYTFYSTLNDLFKEQENVIDFVKKLYSALKDVPLEELQGKLISEIANIIQSGESNS